MEEKHIVKEGSREHVVSWYSKNGKSYRKCSRKNCELNKLKETK